MTDYQPHVWYDFGADRHQPQIVTSWWQRDAAAIRLRDQRLAEMQARDELVRGRVLPLRRVTR